MAQLTIVYWRDIPAQVIVKQGRTSAKRQLSDLYQKAIDAAAMKAGAADTDAYLNDWRRGDAQPVEGDVETLADTAVADLEAAYGPERLKALISTGGLGTP
ncbi:MAG: virulence factor [Rhodospirillaceae bacterium]|nr:virulence factor [Rhodospirillaceae bacterium]MBL6929942.1 virulence factor [Rhodospirillales bacterium]MBL6942178.1 virulence factor [Rhodospirillales bacterium]